MHRLVCAQLTHAFIAVHWTFSLAQGPWAAHHGMRVGCYDIPRKGADRQGDRRHPAVRLCNPWCQPGRLYTRCRWQQRGLRLLPAAPLQKDAATIYWGQGSFNWGQGSSGSSSVIATPPSFIMKFIVKPDRGVWGYRMWGWTQSLSEPQNDVMSSTQHKRQRHVMHAAVAQV